MTAAERQEFDALKQQVANLTEANRTQLAFRDNHFVWLQETGNLDKIVKAVLGSTSLPATPLPTTNSGEVSNSPVISTNYPIGAYKLPIRPLTNAEQRNAIDALVRGGYVDGATKIEMDWTKGIYPLQDLPVVERVREVYWNTATPAADKAALLILLSAIDQRDMQTNAILAPNDPRVFPISGTLGGNTAATTTTSVPASTPVVYADSVVMVNPETGFTNWISTSQNDDGLSILYNTKYPWQAGAPSNPLLPQNLIRVERDGGVSITGTAPQMRLTADSPVPVPVERTPWDGLRGKDIVFYPNGFARDGLGKGPSVDIACMQAGRTLRLGASSATASPTFPMEISPNGVAVNGKPL
jgi:hypothetical protein